MGAAKSGVRPGIRLEAHQQGCGGVARRAKTRWWLGADTVAYERRLCYRAGACGLDQSGALTVTDPAFQRVVQFLMNTQLEDGSWYVKRRALPIQPFFESGFPHGRDQFISAAATNWAATALALAAAPRTSALLKRHN